MTFWFWNKSINIKLWFVAASNLFETLYWFICHYKAFFKAWEVDVFLIMILNRSLLVFSINLLWFNICSCFCFFFFFVCVGVVYTAYAKNWTSCGGKNGSGGTRRPCRTRSCIRRVRRSLGSLTRWTSIGQAFLIFPTRALRIKQTKKKWCHDSIVMYYLAKLVL